MTEYDPIKCAEHGMEIDVVKRDVKDIKNKLFGNGQKGMCYIVERNSTWLKINLTLHLIVITGLITLILRGFANG